MGAVVGEEHEASVGAFEGREFVAAVDHSLAEPVGSAAFATEAGAVGAFLGSEHTPQQSLDVDHVGLGDRDVGGEAFEADVPPVAADGAVGVGPVGGAWFW